MDNLAYASSFNYNQSLLIDGNGEVYSYGMGGHPYILDFNYVLPIGKRAGIDNPFMIGNHSENPILTTLNSGVYHWGEYDVGVNDPVFGSRIETINFSNPTKVGISGILMETESQMVMR